MVWQSPACALRTSLRRPQRRAPLTPSEVLPVATALSAYSICTSLPDGEKVVKLKLYADSPTAVPGRGRQAGRVSRNATRQVGDGLTQPLPPCASRLAQTRQARGRRHATHWRQAAGAMSPGSARQSSAQAVDFYYLL
eukprot:scaffold13854_cov140-Isochrysis_galbana.AAC.4